MDETLGSMWKGMPLVGGHSFSNDEMDDVNGGQEERYSRWRSGIIMCFSFKALWKVEDLFIDNDKIVLTLNTFLTVISFFDAEGSTHDSIDDAVRILGRQGVDACFAFEVDALLCE